MTWRITDRETFETLRRDGVRARSGPISVTFVASGGENARVAYAIGRRVGNSVERNRLRRRLRAAVRQLEEDAELRPGAYLVTPVREALQMTSSQLPQKLREVMRRVQDTSR